MSQTGSILTLNAGSSSLKFALYDTAAALTATVRGEIEDLDAAPHLLARDAAGAVLAERRRPAGATPSFEIVLKALLDFTDAHLGHDGLVAVGHRVVHVAADHIAPEMITPALPAALEALTPLDPLHMPDNLAPMRAVAAARPALVQVACFDTAFHHTMPRVAARFALPRALAASGVRRYGFHGLSYEYIAGCLKQQAPELARGRVIAAHLGSGAGLCALRDGSSIATTTGFSALDGLVMATHCGSLDPGVILYLGQRHDGPGRRAHPGANLCQIRAHPRYELCRHSGLDRTHARAYRGGPYRRIPPLELHIFCESANWNCRLGSGLPASARLPREEYEAARYRRAHPVRFRHRAAVVCPGDIR